VAVDQEIAERFDDVIDKGQRLIDAVRSDGSRDRVDNELCLQWQSQGLTLLQTVFGPDHTFARNFETSTANQGIVQSLASAVSRGQGVLKGAQENFMRGWTWTLKERVHLEVFDDFLAMAEFLIREHALKDPAAVLAGGVLETHLRKLCEKYDLPSQGTVNVLNESLRKKEVYPQNEWRSVQAWYDLRTDAAHGRYENYDQQKVEQMIDGIRGFLDRHPA
jgi:hypothetical protein